MQMSGRDTLGFVPLGNVVPPAPQSITKLLCKYAVVADQKLILVSQYSMNQAMHLSGSHMLIEHTADTDYSFESQNVYCIFRNFYSTVEF